MTLHSFPVSLIGTSLTPPAGKRLPQNVHAWGLGSTRCELQVIPNPDSQSLISLGFMLALDHRAETTVVLTDSDGVTIGSCEIRFGGQFQPYNLTLTQPLPKRLFVHADGAPVWLIIGDSEWAEAAPQLWWASGNEDHHTAAMGLVAEPHCQQQFGWKDGCLTDGLRDLLRATGDQRYAAALQRRIRRFVHADHLVYEGPTSEPCDGRFSGIESCLPVAALMEVPGGGALPDQLLHTWRTHHTQADGTISDGEHLSTEGCYTIAWPLACIARRDRDAQLGLWALQQLSVRHKRLVTAEGIWQVRDGDGPRRLAGWARGVAWYLIGHVRTIAALEGIVPIPDSCRAEVRRAVNYVADVQRDDGLWGNFISDPTSAIDTSGSAGIAVGMAHAAALDLVPSDMADRAAHASRGLTGYLSPDGWLGGCAQENKGGESLQRSTYRVQAPFALGLWAQLQAVLMKPSIAKCADF